MLSVGVAALAQRLSPEKESLKRVLHPCRERDCIAELRGILQAFRAKGTSRVVFLPGIAFFQRQPLHQVGFSKSLNVLGTGQWVIIVPRP